MFRLTAMIKNLLRRVIGNHHYLTLKSYVVHKLKPFHLYDPSKGNIQKLLAEHVYPNAATGGVFVEAGACDGIRYSNSFILEQKYGWHRVLVEPVKGFLPSLKKYPTSHIFNCALVGSKNVQSVEMINMDVHSGVLTSQLFNDQHVDRFASKWGGKSYEQAEARTLADVLNEAQIDEIDWFFLDVEGFEIEALRGLSGSSIKMNNLVVEADNIKQVEGVLANLGLKFAYESVGKSDYWFRFEN